MKDALKRFVTNDIVVRAVKTAIQAFLSVLVLSGPVGYLDLNVVKAAGIAAGAAAISALYNGLKAEWGKKRNTSEEITAPPAE